MKALSNRIVFSIGFGIALPIISIINFRVIGQFSGNLRLLPPILVGLASGFLIGLLRDRWLSINNNLEKLVSKRTNELKEKIDALYKSEKERAKTIKDLEKALAEVKTLSGLLPICASCKNIRDDKGYWNSIETFVGDRSEAQFSHSLCPDCAQKLYPEQMKRMKPKS